MNKLDNIKPNINFRDWSLSAPVIRDARYQDRPIPFDLDNLFPQRLLEIVSESPMQTAILNNRINYILGAGFTPTIDNIYTPNLQESWYSLFEKCVRDFVYLGAFSIQCILNESGTRYSFYHVPVDQVRLGRYSDKNIIEKAYLCSDWRKSNRDRIVEIKMWGTETPKKGERYLMYFKPYKATEYYYAIPYYYSAINYILADAALGSYYNNYIRNNFSANLAIKYPTEPPEDKKDEIYRALIDAFGGQENAGNILLLFGEGGVVPEINPIESVNADLYNSVCDTVKRALVSANRLTSPVLAGISTSTGFSSKSDELISAMVMYKLTVIAAERQFLLGHFNDLLGMNGHKRVLTIDDYNLTEEFNGTNKFNTDKMNEGVGAGDAERQAEEDAEAEDKVEDKEV